MPRKCTWITASVETPSEGGYTIYIPIHGATAIDDLLASEEFRWTFIIKVGVCIRLSGVSVDRICSGDRDTRNGTGEQGAAMVVAPE
jgi:hypothetical protein